MLPPVEAEPDLRHRLPRAPGQGLTQRHGPSFGDHVRSRGDDDEPDRHPARGCDLATSNMAENHPVGFQWVMKAKERGAKLIHVDPRYTRTSAAADLHVPLRSGTNIVFFGGLIRYAIEQNLYFRDYVVHYTNAS